MAATVTVGRSPQHVALDGTHARLYVSNVADETVSVLDTATRTVVATASVARAGAIAVDPAAGRVYVSEGERDQIRVLDARTLGDVGSFPAGKSPLALVPGTSGVLSVANYNYLLAVDTATGQARSTVMLGNPLDLAVDHERGLVYVSDLVKAHVSVIDTNTMAVVAQIRDTHGWLALDTEGQRLYVADPNTSRLVVVDTATREVKGRVAVGTSPNAVAVDGAAGVVYTANFGNRTMSVVDPQALKRVGTLSVWIGPMDLAVDPAAGTVYVANSGGNTIAIVT